jgi:arginase family enzyme
MRISRIQVITHAKTNGEILRLGRMLSFEIVEVNPVIDEHSRTADLAVELALSAFGKKIL